MPRYSHVPWLEAADLQPYGEPETVVELPGRVALGFRIPCPFGKDTDAMLTVTAEGDSLTAAITNEIRRTAPVKTMDMRLLQSNPRRRINREDAD